MPQVPAAIVFLLIVAVVNAWGIKESLRANVAMTLIESAGLVLVIVLGAWVIGRGDANLDGAFTAPEGTSVGVAVLASALIAFYSFVGFETSANLAEEVRDVSRVYPRALFGSLATAGVVYVAIGFVAPAVVAPAELAESTGPLLEVVRAAGGVNPQVFAVGRPAPRSSSRPSSRSSSR